MHFMWNAPRTNKYLILAFLAVIQENSQNHSHYVRRETNVLLWVLVVDEIRIPLIPKLLWPHYWEHKWLLIIVQTTLIPLFWFWHIPFFNSQLLHSFLHSFLSFIVVDSIDGFGCWLPAEFGYLVLNCWNVVNESAAMVDCWI